MYKNLAGQKIRVFAFNRTTAVPVTGDAANITCKVSIDNGSATALSDTNPTETEDGYYLFDLAQAETNGNTLDFYPESSTSDVQVITAGHDRQTVISSSSAQAIATGYAGYFGASYFGGGIQAGAGYPPPSKVLSGFIYGPSNIYTGTAPENRKSAIPFLVRGDDHNTVSRLIETIITAPTDAGSVGSCSAVFAGYHDEFKTGWKVTGGTVEDLGGGLWKLKSTLTSADTLTCRPGCGYRWTHTLLDASGNIRTQQHGVTDLIDGYTVDRYSA